MTGNTWKCSIGYLLKYYKSAYTQEPEQVPIPSIYSFSGDYAFIESIPLGNKSSCIWVGTKMSSGGYLSWLNSPVILHIIQAVKVAFHPRPK